MDFSWIKKIFKKKEDKEKENNSLTKTDTTFTNIREFKNLKKEEKNIVLKYFKKINLDNYEELVKFSNDLANLYKLEQDVLKQTIERYADYLDKTNSGNNQERIGFQQINIAKLAICEFDLILKNIKNIRDELEYRYVAIDLFIKKFDKPNLFKKVSRAEKIEYLTKKDSLYSERERIRVLIRTADIISCATYKRIQTDQVTQKCYELNKLSNNILKTNNNELYLSNLKKELGYLIQQVNNRLADSSYITMDFTTEIKDKILDKLTKEKEELADKTKNELLRNSLRGEIVILKMIWYELDKPYGKEYCSLPSFLDDNYLEELFKISAKYLHQHEIYRCVHKDDYKIYLKEMTDIYNKFRSTPTKDWDKDYLEWAVNNYDLNFENYLKTFRKDTSQEEIDKVYDILTRLKWLYALLTQEEDIDYHIEFMKYSSELLMEVEEKYGVKYEIKDLHSKKAQENYRYIFIEDHMYNEFIYLFDLLNGNEDSIKIFIPSQPINNSFRCDFELFLKMLGTTIGNNIMTFPEYKNDYFEYSLEDIFYTLKFLGIKKLNLMKYDYDYQTTLEKRSVNSFLHRVPFKEKSNGDFTNYLATIKMNELEKQYDERILIIPNTISPPGFDSIRKKILRSKYGKKECVYVPDDELLRFCISELVNPNSYKNIIAKESTITSFMKEKDNYKKTINFERYQNINNFYKALLTREELLDTNPINTIEMSECKIIIVPDDTNYSELSNKFDQALKEDDKTLKKELVS